MFAILHASFILLGKVTSFWWFNFDHSYSNYH